MSFNSEPLALSRAQRSDMRQIDLNNYYKNEFSMRTIYCQICEVNITKADVFEHTISKRHKYNKLFVGIAQGNYPNKDLDFIVVDRDKLQCRHCDFVTINSNEDDITSHIEKSQHKIKKQRYLDKTNILNGGSNSVNNKSLKPLDSLITLKLKHRINTAQYSVSCGVKEITNDTELPKYITVTKDSMYECKVCSKLVPYTNFNLNQHIHGKAHKEMLQKSSEFSVIQERKIETQQELTKPIVTRLNPTYTCTTCRTEMINTTVIIEMHNSSRIHFINVQKSRASLLNMNYRTPTPSYERPTVSYPGPSRDYQRPTTCYNTPKKQSGCNVL